MAYKLTSFIIDYPRLPLLTISSQGPSLLSLWPISYFEACQYIYVLLTGIVSNFLHIDDNNIQSMLVVKRLREHHMKQTMSNIT